MKKIIFILFTICFSSTAYSQKDYTKIDCYARTAPDVKAVTVSDLANYLTAPAKNDSEKVRSIFTWMTSHIKYDWDAYTNNTAAFLSTATILKYRKGVCQNFSDLFTALCSEAGLEAITISGYAKSGVDNSWMLNGFGSSNHAWNVVKINGNWQLMDVTWAQNGWGDIYFMADPYKFRKNHLPGDPKWQQTKDTLTLEEYENIPIPGYAFEKDTVTHLTPMLSCIRGKKNIVFEFDSPATIQLRASVKNYDYNDKSVPKFTQKTTHIGNHYRLELTFSSEKIYWVELDGGSYFSGIVSYVVDTHLTTSYGSR